jgi:MSHA pilin protein MshB
MKKSLGFTLIELVIVVVILGFLAVTAIPKFLDLTDQAKQANIEGMAGGFATAISLARAQWEAEGRQQSSSNLNSVDYDGTTLVLTTEATGIRPGYVTGLTGGNNLDETGFTAVNCVEIWKNILQQPPNITSVFDDVDSDIKYFASKSGDGADATCHFYLKESLNRDTDGNYADPLTSTTIGNSFTYQPANSAVVVYVKKDNP